MPQGNPLRPGRVLLAWLPLLVGAGCAAPTTRLEALFAEEWALHAALDPLWATSVGEHAFDDRLPAVDAEARDHEQRTLESLLQRLEAIPTASLESRQQVDAQMFKDMLAWRLEQLRWRADQIPFLSDSGFHTELAQMPAQMPFESLADHERYLQRLRAIPAYVDQRIASMREGLARGMCQPRVILDGVLRSVEPHVSAPEDSVFFAPFLRLPETLPAAARERLRTAGREVVERQVAPAFARLAAFLDGEYRERTRTSLGASELPQGRAYYAALIRHHTTLDLDAEEVHAIGLEEVKRIRAEMEQVIQQTGFRGDFAAFLAFLRTDPRFYARSPEELLQAAMVLCKQMEAELPRLFSTLPRQPVGVRPVPAHLAPNYTGGRYVPAAPGSNEPGWYWVNTHALESRPLYVLDALTFHEAVPGHHLQMALAAELQDLPRFRRHTYINAHGEGWALYCEKLAREVGFYRDPYREFGRLTYEMWRACRLVVDTGLHAFGWTRDRAREYLAENTALSLHEIGTEVDRYISWPGQALSYKIGELKIWELRHRAEQVLGERFDLRDFHRVLLENGSVPLDELERQVSALLAAPR